jgi:ketosteroid isomerase-like protein
MKKRINLAAFILFGFLNATLTFAQQPIDAGEKNMTANQNKQVVLRLFDEVFNQREFSVIDELYQPNVTDHSAFPDQPPGIDGIRSAIKGFFELFDNIQISVEDVVTEGDKVVTREVWKATHKTSGKVAEGTIIHIFRVREGKIVDEWSRGWDWVEDL